MAIYIQPAESIHAEAVLGLYQTVSKSPNGIIRRTEEITPDYITDILHRSMNKGLILLAVDGEQVIGEMHAYTPNIFAFQHILTDLTIVVHPEYQGRGLGRKLFSHFLKIVREDFPHILRVELYVREHHSRNVGFYQSLGFQNEGRQSRKIFVSAAVQETPLHMVWTNPSFKPESD